MFPTQKDGYIYILLKTETYNDILLLVSDEKGNRETEIIHVY